MMNKEVARSSEHILPEEGTEIDIDGSGSWRRVPASR